MPDPTDEDAAKQGVNVNTGEGLTPSIAGLPPGYTVNVKTGDIFTPQGERIEPGGINVNTGERFDATPTGQNLPSAQRALPAQPAPQPQQQQQPQQQAAPAQQFPPPPQQQQQGHQAIQTQSPPTIRPQSGPTGYKTLSIPSKGFTKSERAWIAELVAAINTARAVAGANVTISNHEGSGQVINAQ